MKSSSKSVGKSGVNINIGKSKRELMQPDEIMTMPFDECIVMMNHISPFYDKKYPLETHPQFKNTGDGDENNFYFLEKDPEFLCVNKTEEHMEDTIKDKFENAENEEKYMPKTLEEVLGDLLVNIPDDDGYFLIKDADAEVEKDNKKALCMAERDEMFNEIEKCISKRYKTPFYDGKQMEPAIIKNMAARAMRKYEKQVDDIVVSCDGLIGGYKMCAAAAKDEECNVIKVSEKLNLELNEAKSKNNTDYAVYKIKESLSPEKYEKFTSGCKNGYKTIVSESNRKDDDDDLDYDDDDY